MISLMGPLYLDGLEMLSGAEVYCPHCKTKGVIRRIAGEDPAKMKCPRCMKKGLQFHEEGDVYEFYTIH